MDVEICQSRPDTNPLWYEEFNLRQINQQTSGSNPTQVLLRQWSGSDESLPLYLEENMTTKGSLLKVSVPQGSQPSS